MGGALGYLLGGRSKERWVTVPNPSVAAVVTEIEPRGDRVRVRAGDLSADVTAQALAELDLVPGVEVTFTVKATEVSVYRTSLP